MVAVSGGPDSLCLLGILMDLRARRNVAPGELIVAHLDHALRAESSTDAEWVRAFASARDLPCVTERADVKTLALTEHRSIEDAARVARYTFLRRVASTWKADRICTGHTRDDQAETILMHLIRGAGLSGLKGMAPLAGDLARPLLDITRAETGAYCEARGWQPLTDPTNVSIEYTRNHIRHEVLPVLQRLNPRIRDTLSRNARLIAADDEHLDDEAATAWESIVWQAVPGSMRLTLLPLQHLPMALRYRLYRNALARITPDHDTVEAAHIFAIDRLAMSGHVGQVIHLRAGLRAIKEYDTLNLVHPSRMPEISAAPESGTTTRLEPPGEARLPTLGWRLRARYTTPGDVRMPLTDHRFHAALDADAVGHALTIRTWLPGDRFRPLGMVKEKKVQDFFTDAKVPRAERRRVPLVFSDTHLVWVAGYRIDDRVRVTEKSRLVLVLDLEPLNAVPDDTGV